MKLFDYSFVRIMALFFMWVAIGNAPIYSQATKYVLFEHFTQASCGPCASQNPGFQDDILAENVGAVHHIAYHTSWPGVDPMNAYNPTENADRVTYYGVSGVPAIQMLGKYWTGSPAGVSQSMVNSETSKGSPIKILVSETSDGTNRYVEVVVHTVGTPPSGSMKLRAAVIEEEIIYPTAPGNNGEKEFPNVFRKMLPNTTGDDYTAGAQGDSVIFNYSYSLDLANWDTSKISVVAFVQDETTGEVINSGATLDPKWNMLASSSGFQEGVSGGSNQFLATLSNMSNSDGNFRINFSKDQPIDWTASFTFNSVNYSDDSLDIILSGNSSENIEFQVQPGNTPGIGNYTATLKSLDDPSYSPKVFEFTVISGVTDLVVSNSSGLGDGSPGDASNWLTDYTDGLDYAGNTTYGTMDNIVLLKGLKENGLSGVSNIYYNVGWTFPAFSDELIEQLVGFLDNGGNLLVAGQDVGWDTWEGNGTTLWQDFYTNYLNANYINDLAPAPNDSITFNGSDAVFGSLSGSDILNYYGGGYYYPDQIAPINGAEPICFYNSASSNVGGVRYTDCNFKTILLGIGLEMVGNATIKHDLMKTAHDWFWNTSGVSLSSTSTEESCTGCMDGTATVAISGGSGTYNYLWNDPSNQTTSTAVGLAAGDYLVTVVDSVLCETFYLEITVGEPTVGMNQNDANPGIFLYPNPASSVAYLKVNLQKSELVSVKVFNFSGKLMVSRNYGTLNGGYTLPINTKYLSTGIYAISIQIGDMIETKKLVIN